jgi:lipoprotein-releasing system permease protein
MGSARLAGRAMPAPRDARLISVRYELKVAMRYLRARRKEAFISITTIFTATGVTIGVAALTIVISVMNGFEADLRERVLSLTPHVQILSYAGSITDYAAIMARAAKVPGVKGADPFVVGQGMVSSRHGISGALIRGVEPANPVVVDQVGRYIDRGDFAALGRQFTSSDPAAQPVGALALGAGLAEKLKLKVGDTVKLVAPILGPNSELTTKTAAFQVGAIFDSGVAFIDNNMVFVRLGLAQGFFGREGKVDGVEVQLTTLDATARVTDALRRMFPHPYHVRNWIEYNQAASAGFAMLKRVYSLVLLMLIGVAAFNLVATLIMVVMEKRKDIAVLMTMGATPREVGLIFVFKGLIVGGAGTAAGLILGAAGCFALSRYHFIRIPREIYGISTLPIAVSMPSFVLVALASILLCYLATIYPARQASRELPAEVLRS